MTDPFGDLRERNRRMQGRVNEMLGEFERLRASAGELQQKMRDVKVTVTSDDGFVKVTVGPHGHLEELELNPRIYRRPDSTALAATITETVKRAVAEAQQKVVEIYKPFVPEADLRAHLDGDHEGIASRVEDRLTEGIDRS